MVVNVCRNEKLEFEGQIVKIKTFEKKSKQARNKVSSIFLNLCRFNLAEYIMILSTETISNA